MAGQHVKMELERDVVMALRQVFDPEIAVNIYDLGLIYELKVGKGMTEGSAGQESGGVKQESVNQEGSAGQESGGVKQENSADREGMVSIKMTLTAPNCPMADYVVDQVRAAVLDVPGVTGCDIELVWEPAWDQSRMSEEALVELGLDN